MYWNVRGTEERTGRDIEVVVEAECKADAEYKALKQGIPVIIVEEATSHDVAVARKEGRLWKYSPDPKHTILGQPVGAFQLAMIMFCGIATMLLVLRANHVTMKLAVPKVVNWTSVSVDHHYA